MKRTILTFVMMALTIAVMAVPAKKGIWKTLTLSDGTTVTAMLAGDEHGHYWQAADGTCYVKLYDIKLRSGLKMLAAYYNGDQSRLTSNEKKALQIISKAVDDMALKYPRGSVDLELAIYDYICDHLE